MRFADLWRWDGKVSRGKYAAVGLIGVAIKHNLDRLIAGRFLGYERSFFNCGEARSPLGYGSEISRHDVAVLDPVSVRGRGDDGTAGAAGVGNKWGGWGSFF